MTLRQSVYDDPGLLRVKQSLLAVLKASPCPSDLRLACARIIAETGTIFFCWFLTTGLEVFFRNSVFHFQRRLADTSVLLLTVIGSVGVVKGMIGSGSHLTTYAPPRFE